MNSALYDQVNDVLAEFAVHVGLDTCALDEDGGAQFAVDSVLVSLLLDEDAETLLFMTSLGQPEATADLYGRLLDANLFWNGAGGGTLARERASGAVVLQQALPSTQIDIVQFEDMLQSFVNTAERLSETLVRAERTATAPATDLRLPEHFLRG